MYTAFTVRQRYLVLPCFNTSWDSSHRLPFSRLHFPSLQSRRPWKIECFPSKKISHVCLSFSKIKIVSLQDNIQAGSLPIIKDFGSLSSGCPSCNSVHYMSVSLGLLHIIQREERGQGTVTNADTLATATVGSNEVFCLWNRSPAASMKLLWANWLGLQVASRVKSQIFHSLSIPFLFITSPASFPDLPPKCKQRALSL